VFRGNCEEMLTVALRLDSEVEKPKWDAPFNPCEGRIALRFGIANKDRPADKWLADTMRLTDTAASSGKATSHADKQNDAKRMGQQKRQEERQPVQSNAMAAAFAKLRG